MQDSMTKQLTERYKNKRPEGVTILGSRAAYLEKSPKDNRTAASYYHSSMSETSEGYDGGLVKQSDGPRKVSKCRAALLNL